MLHLCASNLVCWCVIDCPSLPVFFFFSYCATPDLPVVAGKLMLQTGILLLPVAWDFIEKGQWLVWGQVG